MPHSLVRRLVAAALLAVCAVKGQAAEELRYFHLLSGDAAGSGYAMAEALAAVISGPPGAPSCSTDSRCGVSGLIGVAQSSPGPITSLSIVAEGLADAALVRAGLIHYVDEKSIVSRGALPNLRHVSNVGTHQLHLITANRLHLRSVKQLTHYRIGIGSPRSEVPAVAMRLLEAAGLPAAKMQLVTLSDVEAADLLVAGELDAMIFVGDAKTRFVADLLSDGIGTDLAIEEEVLDRLVTDIAGTYKINLPDPVREGEWRQVLAFPVSLIVNRQTGARLVQAVLGAIWWQGNRELITAGGLGPLTYARAFEMMQLPLHEGAGLYFADHGGLPRGVIPRP